MADKKGDEINRWFNAWSERADADRRRAAGDPTLQNDFDEAWREYCLGPRPKVISPPGWYDGNFITLVHFDAFEEKAEDWILGMTAQEPHLRESDAVRALLEMRQIIK